MTLLDLIVIVTGLIAIMGLAVVGIENCGMNTINAHLGEDAFITYQNMNHYVVCFHGLKPGEPYDDIINIIDPAGGLQRFRMIKGRFVHDTFVADLIILEK